MNSDKRRRGRIQGGWAIPSPTLIKHNLKPEAKNVCKSETEIHKLPVPSWLFKNPTSSEKYIYQEQVCGSESDAASSIDFIEKVKYQRFKTATSIKEFNFQEKRVRVLSKGEELSGGAKGLVYWMSRDQRVQDNWAFLYAQQLAFKSELPLHVCFCLVPKFLDSTMRHFGFMLKGLREVEKECRDLGIAFHLLIGPAVDNIPKFVSTNFIGGVVTDFSPLRVPISWVNDVKQNLPNDVPLWQVDAHNIVPCWEVSAELEYETRIFRYKMRLQMSQYFTEFPPIIKHPYKVKVMPQTADWNSAETSLEVNRTVTEVEWASPGTTAGLRTLEKFLNHRLIHYNVDRNNPDKYGASNMSPWYHFGQVSAQRAMLMVDQYSNKYKESVDWYLDQGIIRRELAENFCFYNKNYDNIEGIDDWAKETLNKHIVDKREYLYSREQLEQSRTHDQLWNAAQTQMVKEGKMHGFLRMYWAKKILEWKDNPETALSDAIYLNDKYSLDGRDPIGYGGIMWSICGIHDRAFKEREIFGTIRYMSYYGCLRKFDVPDFQRRYKTS